MIDFAFAALLALITLGVGKRLLDWMGQTPENPLDAAALALPLGMGAAALAALAIGEIGCLNVLGVTIILALFTEVGVLSSIRLARLLYARQKGSFRKAQFDRFGTWIALCTGAALLASCAAVVAPVTDGDALCYHLQVPKAFLMRGSVGYLPDLHETVYPLITELLYALALEIRGPVACRGIQWFLGLALAANVIALARPNLGRRAWWAGAVILLAPAVSNGMTAPLNDVALAAFGMAAIFAWTRLHDRPSYRAAFTAGLFAGLAMGIKYPALILFGLLASATALRVFDRRPKASPVERHPWARLVLVYVATAIAVGGCWYLRAYVHTGNPVFPFFRSFFGGAGLDEVLAPSKRPLPLAPLNLLFSIVPLSMAPDRFDSFSHQFGPIFLLFLPALLFERAPRRVCMLTLLGYLFLTICLTQRQSMRFLLISLGPLSVAVAYLASVWWQRRTLAARCLLGILILVLGFEASLATVRARHGLSILLGRESVSDYLTRREPTYRVGRWAALNLPAAARLIGQDHRGFYIPRDYTMELAHRRRTGLGLRGERAPEVVASLIQSGFTHVMLCPPVSDRTVEFDPTLGELLEPWTRDRTPLYHDLLSDADGLVRRYLIYDLSDNTARNDNQVKKVSGTVSATARRVPGTTVLDPFVNQAGTPTIPEITTRSGGDIAR
jgi:Dolichyl-phosphate-mannose-protein mannosyltransferase